MFCNCFYANPMQRLTMVKIVFIGFSDFKIFVGTYKQFKSVLWNELFY